MSVELIMLGTGHALVRKCYNTCFVLRNGENCFLVDGGGGNGLLSQMDKAGVDTLGIRDIFITHAHTDHLFGVIWMLRTACMNILSGKYQGALSVYCHDELADLVRFICSQTLPAAHTRLFGDRVLLKKVEDGDKADVCGLEVQFFDILAGKSKQFGFKVQLPDARTLACLGDEPYNPGVRKYAESCDWLMCEAFCLYRDREIFRPYDKNHSTALDAGRLAEELKIKNLLLYHAEDTDLAQRKALYTNEAASVFSGKVFVPDDLDKILL